LVNGKVVWFDVNDMEWKMNKPSFSTGGAPILLLSIPTVTATVANLIGQKKPYFCHSTFA
jgi:hypothetical protein